MFIAGLIDLLQHDAGLTALVGTRIQPSKAEFTEDMPTLTYLYVYGGYDRTVDTAEIVKPKIQFDVWAYQFIDCENVAHALRNALNNYSGTLSDGTRVMSSQRCNQISGWDDTGNLQRLTVEYEFMISEAA